MDVSNSSMPTIAGTLAISKKASNSIGAWNSKNASKSMYANYNRDASNSRASNIFGRGVLGHHVSKQQIPMAQILLKKADHMEYRDVYSARFGTGRTYEE